MQIGQQLMCMAAFPSADAAWCNSSATLLLLHAGPPVFALTFLKGYRPLVFHLPFWTGVAFGVVMQLSSSPCCKASMNVSGFAIGSGHYATLLGFNVVSAVVCWALAGESRSTVLGIALSSVFRDGLNEMQQLQPQNQMHPAGDLRHSMHKPAVPCLLN
jgi:hypothetical protein